VSASLVLADAKGPATVDLYMAVPIERYDGLMNELSNLAPPESQMLANTVVASDPFFRVAKDNYFVMQAKRKVKEAEAQRAGHAGGLTQHLSRTAVLAEGAAPEDAGVKSGDKAAGEARTDGALRAAVTSRRQVTSALGAPLEAEKMLTLDALTERDRTRAGARGDIGGAAGVPAQPAGPAPGAESEEQRRALRLPAREADADGAVDEAALKGPAGGKANVPLQAVNLLVRIGTPEAVAASQR
jgi:hypothetical protein